MVITNIDKILEAIGDNNDAALLNKLLHHLFDEWVYFFAVDDETFQTGSGAMEIVNVSEDRPLLVPYVNVEGTNCAVVYLFKDTALNCLQPNFRLASLKGKNAFSMLSKMKSIDGLVLQGKNVNTFFKNSLLPDKVKKA